VSTWGELAKPSFLAGLLILGGSAVGLRAAVSAMDLYLTKRPIYAADNRVVQAIPAETQNWVRIGQDMQENQATLEELGTQNYLNRGYIAREVPGPLRERGWKDRPVLDLHLAYYTGMVEAVPHIPERCMVGGGWQVTEGSQTVPVPLESAMWVADGSVPADLSGRVFTARLASNGRYTDAPGSRVRLPLDPADIRMRVTQFTEPVSGQSVYAGYFFIANGGTVPSAEQVRLLAFNLKDDYAYYLKVQVTSRQVSSAEELGVLTGMLMDDLLPEIMRCVPDWVEVRTGEYPADNPRRAGGAG
jgi:hypothetical protein